MSASARLVVQMTPGEKAALTKKARRAGLTASEFVRRRVGQEENVADQDAEAELEAVLAAIEIATPRILHALDETIAVTETMTAALKALGQRRPAP